MVFFIVLGILVVAVVALGLVVMSAVSRRLNAAMADYVVHALVPEPEYRFVEAGDFPHVDRSWYDASQAVLEKEGYVFLADVEITNLRRVQYSFRSFSRVMLSPDGTVCAGFILSDFSPLIRLFGPLVGMKRTSIELAVESEDGRFFFVGSGFGTSVPGYPPEIVWHVLPPGMGVSDVYDAFLREQAVFRRRNPDFIPRRHGSVEDVIASEKRAYALTAAYRKKVGYFTVEEFMKDGADANHARNQVAALHAMLRERGIDVPERGVGSGPECTAASVAAAEGQRSLER